MGVPCITMAGYVHAHNVGVSLLNNVGLGHLFAESEEAYVKLAVQLARDLPELSKLRMMLRELMAQSPVCDGQNFTLVLELAYRNMWERYCKDDMPSLKTWNCCCSSSKLILRNQLQLTNSPEPSFSLGTETDPNQGYHGLIDANGLGLYSVQISIN
ncbi:hypothetical protein QQ045_015371 [Rhodiola kirilowii]